MNFRYYYNFVPEHGNVRNNLIYTSLISEDKKTFVQWYYNDGVYHAGQNEVVDPDKMEEKWQREVKYLTLMSKHFPNHVPEILDIDLNNKKIYLKIEDVDFWQQSLDKKCSFETVLPTWQEQMLDIIKAHKSLNLYKYSMHPSSYFIVDGKLKSINYFFTYSKDEDDFSIKDVESHIYSTRQSELKKYINSLGITWDTPQPKHILENLCWESFRTNYPKDFINKALDLCTK